MASPSTSTPTPEEEPWEDASDGSSDGRELEYFGWVYHIGVNSVGREYCHLRFLLLKGKYVAMYKRDPHENPGIKPIRKGVVSHTLSVEELGRRKVNRGEFYVLRFYNRLDETKKGEIACATAGEARKWTEAFEQAKQQAVYDLSIAAGPHKLSIDEGRTTASHDRHGEPRRMDDRYAEGRYRGRPSGSDRDRDERPVLHESSFGSRLQGRITLPARSPPHRPIELRSDRDRDRERSRGRLSPVRPISYKGRHQDRTGWLPDEKFAAGRGSFRVPSNRRDGGVDPLNFAAPKTLAELKVAKASGSSEEQPAKRPHSPFAAGFQASEELLSFEGPKPLSEILKRKRRSSSGNDSVPSSGDESNERIAEGLVDSSSAAATVKDDHDVSDAQKPENQTDAEEGIKGDVGESLVRDDTTEVVDEVAAEAAEDQELEDFDPKDGDYDEAMEDEEGENAYQDDENAYQDDDEDDEDDFAKKVGVFFS